MSEIVKLSAAVLSNLMFNGVIHAQGAVIELDEATFDTLKASGVVEPAEVKETVAKVTGPTPEDLALMVKDAIAKLEASDFETDGSPKLASVQAALPNVTKGITKKLVGEVWAGLKAATATE